MKEAYMISYIFVSSLVFFLVFLYLSMVSLSYYFLQVFSVFDSVERIKERWVRVLSRLVVIVFFPISIFLFYLFFLIKRAIKITGVYFVR